MIDLLFEYTKSTLTITICVFILTAYTLWLLSRDKDEL